MATTIDDIRVLRDGRGPGLVDELRAAWDAEATFAVLPERVGDERWCAAALQAIPESRRRGHFVLQTSGSTGRPKLVVGSKRRAEALARVLHDAQGNEVVRQTLLCLPLSYSFALINQWVWARVWERELVWTDGLRTPSRFAASLEEVAGGMLCLVGSQVPLLRRYLSGRSFPGVVRVHFAGGRFPQEQLGALGELFPNAAIYNNYGCAEALPRLTVRGAEACEAAEQIGRPLPGVELRQGPDERLEFRSRFQAVGLVDAAGYVEPGPEDWLATGDRGQPEPTGGWRLLGRESEVFKRYGEKVSLPAIRTALQPYVSGELAFYDESDRGGERGYVLVLAPIPNEAERRALLRGLRMQFGRPHWPLRIEAVESLPLTSHGKVDAAALRRQALEPLWKQHL